MKISWSTQKRWRLVVMVSHEKFRGEKINVGLRKGSFEGFVVMTRVLEGNEKA